MYTGTCIQLNLISPRVVPPLIAMGSPASVALTTRYAASSTALGPYTDRD